MSPVAPASPPPVLALIQPAMHWRLEDNVAALVRALTRARQAGATLCLCPELALTGFHRQIAQEAAPGRVAAGLAQLQATAGQLGLALAVGAPSPAAAGGWHNSLVLIDASGEVAGVIPKNGLTPSEATFFVPGDCRPVVALAGLRVSAVLCREIEDLPQVSAQLAGQGTQLLLWPGLMSPVPDDSADGLPRHVRQAQAMAQALGTTLVQSNWPYSLNTPHADTVLGRSVVIQPDGRLAAQLPANACGMGLWSGGDSAMRWIPCEADDPDLSSDP
ncbi:carbon-nitrogen hydrolase family protein [Ideonella livida]|uniref:CN hydrolase domain-containing protein n=1 Tax=Ideonella livida TaxID=2707176 RepID=A0A7C9TKP3_9BURK|nr:nitrilase-related carbon-nitrogen hydrolase [Ideonella livida]NDY92002.1 hypothetical protein [Ideonella livida]